MYLLAITEMEMLIVLHSNLSFISSSLCRSLTHFELLSPLFPFSPPLYITVIFSFFSFSYSSPFLHLHLRVLSHRGL